MYNEKHVPWGKDYLKKKGILFSFHCCSKSSFRGGDKGCSKAQQGRKTGPEVWRFIFVSDMYCGKNKMTKT